MTKTEPRNQKPVGAGAKAPAAATPRYEAPRILAKRPVERVTLVSCVVGPGNNCGGE